jgi:hypothetical protein
MPRRYHTTESAGVPLRCERYSLTKLQRNASVPGHIAPLNAHWQETLSLMKADGVRFRFFHELSSKGKHRALRINDHFLHFSFESRDKLVHVLPVSDHSHVPEASSIEIQAHLLEAV